MGQMIEYKACTGLVEAIRLVLIYNHDWAAKMLDPLK